MGDFKEALAALANLAKLAHAPSDYNLARHAANLSSTIRSALEAAQQEAEAWEEIEAWRKSGGDFQIFTIDAHGGNWMSRAHRLDGTFDEWSGDRLKALTKAAAWCRAEMAK